MGTHRHGALDCVCSHIGAWWGPPAPTFWDHCLEYWCIVGGVVFERGNTERKSFRSNEAFLRLCPCQRYGRWRKFFPAPIQTILPTQREFLREILYTNIAMYHRILTLKLSTCWLIFFSEFLHFLLDTFHSKWAFIKCVLFYVSYQPDL